MTQRALAGTSLQRVIRVCVLLALSLCLSACWFVVRFADDSQLRLDPRFFGRWQLADGSGELVIASSRGCSLVQFIAEDDSLRLCSLGQAGDYVLTAFHDLNAPNDGAREYTLGVARWYTADRLGLVMLDGKVTLDELSAPYVNERRDPDCAQREPEDQAKSSCTRLLIDVAQLPPLQEGTLAKLYASGCCTQDDDESVLLRVVPRER